MKRFRVSYCAICRQWEAVAAVTSGKYAGEFMGEWSGFGTWREAYDFAYRQARTFEVVVEGRVSDSVTVIDLAPEWRLLLWVLTPPDPLTPARLIMLNRGSVVANLPLRLPLVAELAGHFLALYAHLLAKAEEADQLEVSFDD